MKINEMVKSMIESSTSFEDADSIIVEFTPNKTVREKLDFLFGTFDVSIIGADGCSEDEERELFIDYKAVLTAIVNKKWR